MGLRAAQNKKLLMWGSILWQQVKPCAILWLQARSSSCVSLFITMRPLLGLLFDTILLLRGFPLD